MCCKCFGILVLAVGFVVTSALVSAASAEESTYVGNSQCKMCHNKKSEGEQWNKWKAAEHSEAFTVLASPEAAEAAAKAGITTPPAESPECLRCHVTGYDVETKTVPDKIKKEDGVQCESCHGASSAHVAEGKKLLMAKDKTLTVPRVPPDEKLCRTCHNEESPTWNPEKYTLDSGEKVGFDFEQAAAKIAHPNPTKQ